MTQEGQVTWNEKSVTFQNQIWNSQDKKPKTGQPSLRCDKTHNLDTFIRTWKWNKQDVIKQGCQIGSFNLKYGRYIRKQWNNNNVSNSLYLYYLQPGTQQRNFKLTWASPPQSEENGCHERSISCVPRNDIESIINDLITSLYYNI